MDKGLSSSSSPSSHRLPTVSASQALKKLASPQGQWVSTGLPQLDASLGGMSMGTLSPKLFSPVGGLAKGLITELYGPPGSGKTALAIQSAVEALHSNTDVVWIDAAYQVVGSRLKRAITARQKPQPSDRSSPPASARELDELLERFHHFTVPTLPHLLAMVCHVPSSFPLEKTSLLVVDGISTLFASAFPDKPEEASPLSKKKSEDAQWAASRRWAIMGEFLSKLGKLAALRGIAVLLISQTSIKIRSNYGAILRPAIPSKTWADNISTRLVVFRDFSDVSNESERQSRSRLSAVGVTKLNGNTFTQLSSVVYFLVNEEGIQQLQINTPSRSITLVSRSSPEKLKRKRKEVADSESEQGYSDVEGDFGWVEEDHLVLQEELDVQNPQVEEREADELPSE